MITEFMVYHIFVSKMSSADQKTLISSPPLLHRPSVLRPAQNLPSGRNRGKVKIVRTCNIAQGTMRLDERNTSTSLFVSSLICSIINQKVNDFEKRH